MQQRFGEAGLVVLGINADNYEKADVEKFVTAAGLKQRILLQGNGVAIKDYSMKRWPSNVYIDRAGRIVDHDFGATSKSTIEGKVRKILEASK